MDCCLIILFIMPKTMQCFALTKTPFSFFFFLLSSPQLCNAGSWVQVHDSGASRQSPQRPLPTSPLHPWAVLLWERPHRGVRALANVSTGLIIAVTNQMMAMETLLELEVIDCDLLSPGQRSVMTVICWTGTAARRNVSRRWASTVTVSLFSLIQSFRYDWLMWFFRLRFKEMYLYSDVFGH